MASSGGADDARGYGEAEPRRRAVVDVETVVISVVSSGALATGIAKAFDVLADRRRARLANDAADRAVDRYVRSIQTQAALERRRAQEATVDAMLGHGLLLMRKASEPPAMTVMFDDSVKHIAYPSEAQPQDLGRLADTNEGHALLSAYEECRTAYPTLAPLVDAFNKLNTGVTRWRAAADAPGGMDRITSR
jgi:hypothetical protein